MSYTADQLIKIRFDKWNNNEEDYYKKLEYDKKLRFAIANEIVSNKSLLEEIKEYPEKLIELQFVVVDKEQKTVPMFLNTVQKKFIEILNESKRLYKEGKLTDLSFLILKGRQQGFTTLITAYQLSSSIVNRNFQGFTLSDKTDNSKSIFENKAKFPFNQLPDILKPTQKFNNVKQLLFDKINSSWTVDTATKNVGRSKTINFFHGSECAFWEDGISPIQAALGEAFTKNCIKIYESTANSFNDYEKMWSSKNHINCFFAWWETPEYFINFESEEIHEEFLKNIETKKEWIFERLKWLKDEIKVDDTQLYWYCKKYNNYIDKDLIKQEYPCFPEEAFLMTGQCVFDPELIMQRKKNVPKPVKVGYFTYNEEKAIEGKMTDIKWVNDKNGYIKIYEVPQSINQYVIGGDTSGEGSDFFIGQVLNAKTGKQVCVYRKNTDADLYAKQMYCLGKYYHTINIKNETSDALIGIETNFDSHPQTELERLGYTHFYMREQEDSITHKPVKKYGFRTDRNSRPRIISQLVQIVRESIENINDEDTLDEMLKFVKNEKGRAEAMVGCHDDLVMALAIAYDIKDQVVLDEVIKPPYQEINGFHDSKYNNYDYGEDLTII